MSWYRRLRAYLGERGGRYLKSGRPCWHGHRNTRIELEYSNNPDGAVQVVLFGVPIVRYEPDGASHVQTFGYLRRTTADRVNEYSDFVMYRDHGVWYLEDADWRLWLRQRAGLTTARREERTWFISCDATNYGNWGYDSASFPVDRRRRITDIIGRPLLSIAQYRRIIAKRKEEDKRANSIRGKRRRQLRRQLHRILKFESDLLEQQGFVHQSDVQSLCRELQRERDELYYRLDKVSNRLAQQLDNNRALLRVIYKYQSRLARLSQLKIAPEDIPQDRDRIIELEKGLAAQNLPRS